MANLDSRTPPDGASPPGEHLQPVDIEGAAEVLYPLSDGKSVSVLSYPSVRSRADCAALLQGEIDRRHVEGIVQVEVALRNRGYTLLPMVASILDGVHREVGERVSQAMNGRGSDAIHLPAHG